MSKSIEASAFVAWRNTPEKTWQCRLCKHQGVGERHFCGCGADLSKQPIPPTETVKVAKALEHA